MNIKIQYNTISFLSQITCSDKIIESNLKQAIEENKDKRITDWFEGFIKRIKEESNNDNFSIEISGCDFYEKVFIESVLARENGLIERKKIGVKKESCIKDEYKNIDSFLDYVLKSNDFILKEAIKPNISRIEDLRCNKVEVPVIATMSSGKSTLLNAILGQDLLFEDTGAATATTCNIKINNKLSVFVAQAIDGNKIIDESNSNISDFLKKWNFNSNTKKYKELKLNIEGPIRDLNSSNLELNFIDTPGPNSAQNDNHKEKTFNYLKDNTKLPIVLYVLDPEKMDSKDDDLTLKEISSVLKNNKDNLDRIIFIYNKVDREIRDNDSKFSDVLVKVRQFLKNYEIENPKIFPISSKYAKLAQLENSLSRTEKGDLFNYRNKFIPDPEDGYMGYPLLEDTPLDANQKKHLEGRITNSKLDADMVYSGLAAIKLYIADYIANHHQKNQYKDLMCIAQNMFEEIENKIKLEKSNLELKSAEKEKKNIERKEKELKELNIKKVEALKAIDKIKFEKGFIQDAIRKIDWPFDNLKNQSSSRKNINHNEATKLIKDFNNLVQNLVDSIKTDLFSKMNEERQSYLLKLKNEVVIKFELKNQSLEAKTFNAELLNKINVMDISRINDFGKTVTEKKGRKVQKDVTSGKWYKRWFGIKDTKTITEFYEVKKTVIDTAKLYRDVFNPKSLEFKNVVIMAESEFDEMFLQYNKSFKNLVNFSFKAARKSVYEKSSEKVALSKMENKKHFQSLEVIINDISNFKKIVAQ